MCNQSARTRSRYVVMATSVFCLRVVANLRACIMRCGVGCVIDVREVVIFLCCAAVVTRKGPTYRLLAQSLTLFNHYFLPPLVQGNLQ